MTSDIRVSNPQILELRAVVNAIDHRFRTLEVWLAAVRGAGVKQDRTGVVLDLLAL